MKDINSTNREETVVVALPAMHMMMTSVVEVIKNVWPEIGRLNMQLFEIYCPNYRTFSGVT